MKERLDFSLLVGGAPDGDTLRTAVLSDLTGKDVFSADFPAEVITLEKDVLAVRGDYRLNLPAEAQSLYDKIVARWTSGALKAKILAGSQCKRHLCYHDEKPWRACVVVAEAIK